MDDDQRRQFDTLRDRLLGEVNDLPTCWGDRRATDAALRAIRTHLAYLEDLVKAPYG
jgi:hypothetical protein